MNKKKVVFVGGVAGGATCATRLRRLDENAEIVVLERGPFFTAQLSSSNRLLRNRARTAAASAKTS
jgi:L-2-hydroxyglutarate oxidase LhgO